MASNGFQFACENILFLSNVRFSNVILIHIFKTSSLIPPLFESVRSIFLSGCFEECDVDDI
jgi:hypothetical protein